MNAAFGGGHPLGTKIPQYTLEQSSMSEDARGPILF
jgi:hypothetical protein